MVDTAVSYGKSETITHCFRLSQRRVVRTETDLVVFELPEMRGLEIIVTGRK
jgi:hypothetical protein